MRAVSRGDAQRAVAHGDECSGRPESVCRHAGYVGDPRGLGAKILALYPDNAQRGLSSHIGVVVLFDSETGLPAAVMDAAEITAIAPQRQSAVATRALSRADAETWQYSERAKQAVTHLEAIAGRAALCARCGCGDGRRKRRRALQNVRMRVSPLGTPSRSFLQDGARSGGGCGYRVYIDRCTRTDPERCVACSRRACQSRGASRLTAREADE